MRATVGTAASILSLLLVFTACPASAQSGYTILHKFAASEGSKPVGGLIMEGGRLYGMTNLGGSAQFGTAFGIGGDGSGFSLLHSFTGAPDSDGKEPTGGFVSDGSRLYGVTKEGGPGDFGLLFRMSTDGTGLTNLWQFGGPFDGKYPSGRPVLHNGRLFGALAQGGASDEGLLYSMAVDGSDKTILHHFGAGSDGKSPYWGLLERDGRLYGTTTSGGTGNGTVYSIGTDGAGYSILHNFSGSAALAPSGTLVSDGTRLYGAALYGGAAYRGTLFSLAIGGGDFTVLHEFAGPPEDGTGPSGGLALDGGALYGTTILGGQHSPIGGGTLFSLKTDGTGYTVLHHFAGDDVTPADGCSPEGDLLISDGVLYGTTTAPGEGTIYTFALGLLRLTLNKTALAAGDRLTVDVEVQPIAQAFDPWAVILGANASYSMVLGSPGSVQSGLRPLARGVGSLSSVYTGRLLDLAIPSGAAGTYQVIVGLVPAGVSPTGVESCIAGYVDQRTVTVQ